MKYSGAFRLRDDLLGRLLPVGGNSSTTSGVFGRDGGRMSSIQGRIYYVADAAYAAGLALIGASRFTVSRPLPQEHAIFY